MQRMLMQIQRTIIINDINLFENHLVDKCMQIKRCAYLHSFVCLFAHMVNVNHKSKSVNE